MASSSEETADTPRSGCWEELDGLYRCVTPKHQFDAVYRHGEFDNCKQLAAAMWACMRGGEARRRAEAAAAGGDAGGAAAAAAAPRGHPVWPLKAAPRWEYGEAAAPEAPADAPAAAAARGRVFRRLTK